MYPAVAVLTTFFQHALLDRLNATKFNSANTGW